MRVLMIGATGSNAGLVLPELVRRGAQVRALIRHREQASEVLARGAAETAIGDLRDPASLRAAAQGIDGVFHIGPAFDPEETDMGLAVVKAAQAAGVRRVCLSSVYHPSLSLSNHAAKRPVEEAVYDSGMEFTVLQPALFMQTLGQGWDEVLTTGQLSGPYSTTAKVCYVDYRDVAEVAARALTEDAGSKDSLTGGTFELCAPGMLDRVEVAALASAALGRPVQATTTAVADLPLPPGPTRDGLAAMAAGYDAHGFAGGNALVLRSILGREPRTLRRYFGELAAAT